MLTELCQELHNWFEIKKYFGTFTIGSGNITAPVLSDGQYFRIVGSIFNDGVHRYPATSLQPETFEGAIWALAIPKAVLDLDTEISAWRGKYEGADSAAMSPFNSESFGGYSYSKGGSNSSSAGNNTPGWKSVFASRLNLWRKI